MGNYRFKLSDMIPNAWFYKLRDIGRGKKQTVIPTRNKKQSSSTSTTQPSKPKQLLQCNPRKSYYFTRELNPTNTKFYTSPTNNPKTPPHTTNSPEPPRKPTSKQRTRRRRRTNTRTSSPKLVSSTVSAGCNCRTTLESVWTKSDSPHENSSSPFDSSPESEFPDPEFRTDRVLPTESSSFDEMVLLSTSCSCRLSSNTTTKDIVMDVDKNSLERKDDKLEKYDTFSQLELPPIITKPQNFNHLLTDAKKKEQHNPRSRISTQDEEQGSLEVKIVKEDISSMKKQQQRSVGGTVRRFSSHSVSSPGLKLRVNSPRIVGLKFHSHGRKSVSSTASSGSRRSLSDSFAIVKSSFNPQKDFRESMVEMIVENNIRASKDLEDLLACYLSLNSDEYHDLIIKVFKQIWFDLTETR